jgi:hypothetical protein
LVSLSSILSLLVCEAGYRVWSRVPFLPASPGLSVPDLYVSSPDLGYELRPGFQGAAFGAWTEVDSTGCRAVPGSQEDLPEIAIIGDSSAFGFGVSQDEALSTRLALATQGRFRVRNYAVPGYNARQLVERFLRDAPPASHPMQRLFCFLDQNDAGDAYRLDRKAGIPYLYSHRPRSFPAVAIKGWALDHFFLLCHLRSFLFGRLGHGPTLPIQNRESPLPGTILGPLEELRVWAKERQTHLTITLVRRRFEAVFHQGLTSFSQHPEVDILTLLEEQEYHHLPWDPHPSPASHRLMSQRLSESLRLPTDRVP